jgi:hypothetical protein
MSRTAVNQEAVAPSRVHAETIDCLSPRGLLKPPSSTIMENIDSILSLPKCSEVNVGRHRRINDPKAKVLTPLPERKLRGRLKKADADDNPNSSKPSTSGAEPNETICGICHDSYSDDVVARTVLSRFSACFVVDCGMSSV